MSIPSVVIITTIHHREIYLAETIESILAQTDPYFTLLLWDDGSTDNSPQIAQQYADKDSRIQLILAPHQGFAPALRSAIAHTQSDYIASIDSDDLLHPTALAETRAILDQHPEIGMVYTNYDLIDAQGQSQGPGQRCQIPYSPDRLLTDLMTFHFRLIRRTAYEAAGGIDPTFPAASDYDLCLRLSEVTQIHHHPSTLYSYRIHPHSISSQKRQIQIDWSAEAIRRALTRRQLNDRYELEIQPPSQFILKPTRSILINAIGPLDILTAALTTALILHHQSPNLPIILLTNHPIPPHWPPLPIQIQSIQFPAIWQNRETALLKTTLTNFTTTSQTLYLDPLLLPITPIDSLWSQLDQQNLSFTLTKPDRATLILWRTLPETETFFTTWKETWLQTQSADPLTLLPPNPHPIADIYYHAIADQTQPADIDSTQIKILQCPNFKIFQTFAKIFWPEIIQQLQKLMT